MVVAVPYLIIVVAMGYSRQGVAIGIILAGMSQLERSSMLRFSIYIFFAAAFHKSAIVVLPLVALSAVRHRAVMAVVLAVLAIMLYYFFVQASFDKMMGNYIEQEYSSQGAAVRVSMNILPAAIYLAFWRRFRFPEQQHKLWRNFSVTALLALAALYYVGSSAAVDRLAFYIIPLKLLLLSTLQVKFSH